MKKFLKKLFIGTFLTLTGLVTLLVVFILYPNNLFAERTGYKAFDVYSHAPLKDDHRVVLDRALELVRASELYDSKYRYDIFLTEGTFYKAFTFQLLGPSMARSLDNNIMLNTDVDFRSNLLRSPSNQRDLARTIAHEMVHCLQLNRYGIRKFSPVSHPPLWKLEGYPEYIAYGDELHAPDYDFTATIDRLLEAMESGESWVETQPGQSDPLVYLKGRVLIEYLMDVKGMTYSEVLDDRIDEAAVLSELLAWRNRH